MTEALQLTLEPEPVEFPEAHYVFIEKRGNIPENAPTVWQQLHAALPGICRANTVTLFFSLYRMDEGQYRAGVAVDAPPRELPDGLNYERFPGGRYRKFVLRGSYRQLGPATGEAFRQVREQGIRLRDGFNIENYVNDPRTTPEAELITEILFPID